MSAYQTTLLLKPLSEQSIRQERVFVEGLAKVNRISSLVEVDDALYLMSLCMDDAITESREGSISSQKLKYVQMIYVKLVCRLVHRQEELLSVP